MGDQLQPVKHLQMVEVVGDTGYHDGWIYVPIHLLDGQPDGAGMQHVELFCDMQAGLDLVQSLLAALHMALADESNVANSIAREIRNKTKV